MDFKYPYTDYHELNLDWFLAEFKKLTADWLQLQHDWEDEQQAFQDLHDYVQDYFANLNLYQEVHDILYSDEMQQTIQLMLTNISASQLPAVVANQIASVVASQLAPVVAAQLPNLLNSMLPSFLPDAVAGEASAWLADHVDPATGYVIDDTLSIALAAADAKTVGDVTMHSIKLNDATITTLDTVNKSIMMLSTNGTSIGGVTANGTLLSFTTLDGSGHNTVNGAIQFWFQFGNSKNIYVRHCYNNTAWTAWERLITTEDPVTMQALKTNQSDITDADNFNSLRVTSDLNNSMSNTATNYGTLAVFAPLSTTGTNTKNAALELWSTYGNNDELYIRKCINNTWRSWVKMVNENDMPDYLAKYASKPSMALFESVGVIGDSFASGYMGLISTSKYKLSWPQIMARKEGIDIVNYSSDGMTARRFITAPTRGLPKVLDDAAKNLYIIALGLNDAYLYSQEPTYLGSISDIDDVNYDQNPDTFFGNMGRIIRNIQVNKPDAKIIMVTTPAGTYNGNNGYINRTQDVAINNAITDIAAHYSLPLIITLSHPLFYSSLYKSNINGNGAHPTATMYAAMANAYIDMWGDTMIDNTSYFEDYYS